MNSFAELSEAGTGVPSNPQAARSWYQKAADLGHAEAMGHLGAMFESGRGAPQNLDTAREWYGKGAARGGRLAMYRLGAMLEEGRGGPQNLTDAAAWYQRAAAFELPGALNALGRLYLAGAGVPKNDLLARSSFLKAAELGDAEAMNNLGMLYLRGMGVPRDFNLARLWLKKAIALDNAEARENLKVLEESAPRDGFQVAARRATCVEACATFHRSYANSVCERFTAEVDGERPQRSRCVGATMMLAQQCRDTCREWAPSSQADNKCLACFETLVACGRSQELPAEQGGEQPYETYAKNCLAAFANCNSSCSAQKRPTLAAPGANRTKPN
jgi:TPR repeat protein